MAVVGFIGLETAGGFQPGLMLNDLNPAVANARDACALAPFGASAQSPCMLQNRHSPKAGRADFPSIQTIFIRPL